MVEAKVGDQKIAAEDSEQSNLGKSEVLLRRKIKV
jgi:hypothetical protein